MKCDNHQYMFASSDDFGIFNSESESSYQADYHTGSSNEDIKQAQADLSTQIKGNQKGKTTGNKTKRIHKAGDSPPKTPKRNRLGQNGKKKKNESWLSEDKFKYLVFNLSEIIEKPYQCVSWKVWKGNQFFTRMAVYIGKKNSQVKSYDERMKKKYFETEKIDIQQFAASELKKNYPNRYQTQDLLKKLQKVRQHKSEHMKILLENKSLQYEMDESLRKLISDHKKFFI